MVNKFLIPSGFNDSLNFNTYIEHQYKNSIINSFIDNGFSLIKTPLIEFTNNLDKNTLLLKTKKNEDNLSIRNDITPQIIRIASSRLAKQNRPLKLCYYGEVVRKTGSILRPERQFQQVGAEIIGSESYKADVEIINLAYLTLKDIGVKNIVIEISAPFFLDSLLKKIDNLDKRKKIMKLILSKNINGCYNILKDKEIINALKLLQLCSGSIKNKNLSIDQLSKLIGFKNEVKRIVKISKLLKISKNDSINIDFFEMQKNKDYYKGIKFTFFAKNVRGEIAGGGRYQFKSGNNFEKAIGYTCYMDTILRASYFTNSNKKILIPFNTDKKMKKKLINKGFILFKSFEDNYNPKVESKKFGIKYFLLNGVIKKI